MRAILLLVFLLSVTTFIVMFVFHGRSANFDPDTQKTIVKSPPCDLCVPYTLDIEFPRPFDRETWSCQVGTYNGIFPPADADPYKLYCVLAGVARWMSAFLVLFSAMVGFLFYVDWQTQRRLIRTWKSREVDTINLNGSQSANEW